LNITEVRVKLMRNRSDRLRAFCSITIDDDFVVHDLRVIEGRKGFFVAMPSRKLTDNCPDCGSKNELRAKFCGHCGRRMDENRATEGVSAREKLHVDVAHPINTPCREMLQETVLVAYKAEAERAEDGLPPQHDYDADGLDDYSDDYDEGGEIPPPGADAEGPEEQVDESVLQMPEEPSLEEEQSEGFFPEPEPEPETYAPEEPEAAEEEQFEGFFPEPEPEPETYAPEEPAEPEAAAEEPEEPAEPETVREEPEDEGFGAGIL